MLAFEGVFTPDMEDAHRTRREMEEDLLKRSRFLVICGSMQDENVKDDIAVAKRAKVIVTTLEGVIRYA